MFWSLQLFEPFTLTLMTAKPFCWVNSHCFCSCSAHCQKYVCDCPGLPGLLFVRVSRYPHHWWAPGRKHCEVESRARKEHSLWGTGQEADRGCCAVRAIEEQRWFVERKMRESKIFKGQVLTKIKCYRTWSAAGKQENARVIFLMWMYLQISSN